METGLYISFLLVSLVLIIVPGPNVLVIVSTSIAHGRKRGLQTVAGTSSAMAIQLSISAVTTTSVIHVLTNGFSILRWLGVIYLIYLGVQQICLMFSSGEREITITGTASFSRGFVVSLTNPKTILFFSAFLPQFVSRGGDYMKQCAILSISFLSLAVFLDSIYAILASRVSGAIRNQHIERLQNGISGVLLLAASVWLAITRRAGS